MHVEKIISLLIQLNYKVDKLMATLDEFIKNMTAMMDKESTLVASLKPFIKGLFDQIKTTVPAITPEQMKALDDIQAKVDANNAAIADSMVSAPPV